MKTRTRSRSSRTSGVIPSSRMSPSKRPASCPAMLAPGAIIRTHEMAMPGSLHTLDTPLPSVPNAAKHRSASSNEPHARRRALAMKRNTLLGELSAEMLGTFTLIVFGVGVVAQTVLTPFSAGAQSIHWAWGIGARNMAPGVNLAPFIIGLIVVGIGMVLGADAGYAINPARDFGPRLASLITGWSNAMKDQRGDFYAWVPIIGPFIGGVLGAFVYDFFIARFLPVAEPEVGRVPEPPETARADS